MLEHGQPDAAARRARNGLTRLATGRKAAGEVALLPLAEIGIPVLPEFAARKEWSF